MKSNSSALSGIRVLDCSRVMAGPYCTMLLGDYGADVIKIEQPGLGDPTRQWGPPWINGQSAYFLSCNRNKRSLTVNLKESFGQNIIKELVKKSDVFIENFKVGYLKKLGLSYNDLIQINPKLIYCSITGYGQTGPYKDEPGYDFILQAQGGLMSITGTNEATKVGIPIVDISTGINACNAILAALFFREKTGEGQYIDCSLLDNQLALLTNVAQNYFVSKTEPKRYGNAHPNIVPYQNINCSDGQIMIAIGSDAQFKRFADFLKIDELKSTDFRTNTKRVQNRVKLIGQIENVTLRKTVKYVTTNLKNLNIPVSKINSIPEILADDQTKNRHMIIEINHTIIGKQKQLGHASKLSKTPASINIAPPVLSEHTNEILKSLLGYSNQKIEELSKLFII